MKKLFFTLTLILSFFVLSHAQSNYWIPQGQGILSEDYIVLDLSAVNDNIVWGLATKSDVSAPLLFKSTNGGDDWETFDLDSLGGFGISIVGFSDQMAWFAGYDSQGDGLIYQTTDGGDTWVLKHTIQGNASNPSIPILKFADENRGYFIDIPSKKSGKTPDGGGSWSEYEVPFATNESWGPLSPENFLFVAGDTLLFGTGKHIWRSTNGGADWNPIDPSFPGSNTITSIDFDENGYGLAVSARNENSTGTFGYLNNTYQWNSEDFGENWDPPATVNHPFICLEHIPGKEKTFVAVSGEGAFAYPQLSISWASAYTTDGGMTWIPVTQGIPYHALSFSSINAGWTGTIGGFDYGFPANERPAVYKWTCTVNTKEIRDQQWDIALWPNPFSDQLNIRSDSHVIERVAFFNVQGQPVLSVSGSDLHERDLSVLPKGLYTIQVWTEDGVAVEKGVKL